MTTRSVRLDDEAERALADIRQQTGQSISSAIKLSLVAFRDAARANARRKPAEFFAGFDLGAGGDAIGPARDSGRLLKDKLLRKRSRR